MRFCVVFFTLLFASASFAQKEKPQNYRRFDERLFHFGFMLGANVSNLSLYEKVDAYQKFGLRRIETQSQPGGQVGILTTMKVGTPVVRLRFIPTLSFQERVIKEYFDDPLFPGDPEKEYYNEERLNATSLDFPLMFQFRTTRLNNFASYVLCGGQYSLDLQSQIDASQDYIDPFIKQKKHDWQGQVGAGVEFFAPFFKFGMELKYTHSFINTFYQDNTPVSNPIDRFYNNGWWFSIIFEG